MFIKNFTHRAHHLVNPTRKNEPFGFRQNQIAAQEDLKQALLTSPAIRPLDHTSGAPVILSVDTSYIAVGFILSQCDIKNPKIRYYSRFRSITLNDREARFSQPKLELYGLFRLGIVMGNPWVSGELPVPVPVKTRTRRTGTGLPPGFSLKSFNILKNKVFNKVKYLI